MGLQPLLHDLVTCVAAPTTALSGRDGQIVGGGAQGVFHGDLRVLSTGLLEVDGRAPEPILATLDGPGRARFVGLVRYPSDHGTEGGTQLRVERRRRATAGGLRESVTIRSTEGGPARVTVLLRVAADLAPIAAVKYGRPTPEPLPPQVSGEHGLAWRTAPDSDVTITAEDAETCLDGADGCFTWSVEVPPHGEQVLDWSLSVRDPGAIVGPPPTAVPWSRPQVTADDRRLGALLNQSLDDLDALRLVPIGAPDQEFLAAGSPWFFTLFGRDSLLAAQMLLPLGTGLAASTLAALAARQGSRLHPDSGEAPGKILHELRRGEFELEGAVRLPPVYYGTIDATLLWVSLLHDAWRWGLDQQTVAGFLPALERAMDWLATDADPDGDGFVEYIDGRGRGLVNQGWKDSGDAVRFRDGRVAGAPIALVEVQGYAYRAAVNAAALLAAFDRPGAAYWLEHAAALADRFRREFWVEDGIGAYPAIALDAGKRRVDALTSNIGHLLGTGILSAEEAALVAGRLGAEGLDSGYGLRTMSSGDGGYSPMSYHCGSVWPHDTAIVAAGLAREGHTAQAASLVAGLIRAAPAFDYRMPELFAGDSATYVPVPIPYPASCRPQAWAATVAVSLLQTLLGLDPDVPQGRLRLAPLPQAPVGALSVAGLRVAGAPLSVQTAPDGTLRQVVAPSELQVHAGGAAP